MKKRLNVVDLFCGAGGLSTGFSQAGFNVVLGIDHNKRAIETFLANHIESQAIAGDITKITSKEILDRVKDKIDLVVGGPPCQGFSMAGKRRPNDPRNSLFKEYLRIVKELSPKAFVMENVRGLMSMKNESGKNVIDIILNEFQKLEGYNVRCYPVNTADYGVPQRRRRIFIIGIKKEFSFTFPFPTHTKDESETHLKRWRGIGNILMERKKIPEKYFYSEKLIKGFLRRERENKKRGVGFGWQFNELEKPSYTISARYWKDGAESLIRYNENNIRMLTPQECAAIQSFPRNYVFKGSQVDVYKQIGNAVPPLMARKIAESLNEALNPSTPVFNVIFPNRIIKTNV